MSHETHASASRSLVLGSEITFHRDHVRVATADATYLLDYDQQHNRFLNFSRAYTPGTSRSGYPISISFFEFAEALEMVETALVHSPDVESFEGEDHFRTPTVEGQSVTISLSKMRGLFYAYENKRTAIEQVVDNGRQMGVSRRVGHGDAETMYVAPHNGRAYAYRVQNPRQIFAVDVEQLRSIFSRDQLLEQAELLATQVDAAISGRTLALHFTDVAIDPRLQPTLRNEVDFGLNLPSL